MAKMFHESPALLESLNPLLSIHQLIAAISRTVAIEQIYEEALDALQRTLSADRASILLFDPDSVMRFKAWRGLSDEYRKAVEGHSPWSPDEKNAQPITTPDVAEDPHLQALLPVFNKEGIRALGFIPLVYADRLLGKFMIYYDAPHMFNSYEIQLAQIIAGHIGFAIGQRRAEEHLRASEQRLRLYREIFINSNDGIAVIDPQGCYIEQNPAHKNLLSYDDDDLSGKTPAIHLGEQTFSAITKELASTGSYRGEVVSCAKDGTTIPVDISAFTVRNAEGEPICFVGIKRDITDRKRAEQEREHLLEREQAARAQAEAANRAKDEFLATVSHELRTPLTPLLGWTQVLRSRKADEEMLAQALDSIERNVKAQAQLVEDVLDVSRIITGKLRLQVEPVELPPIINAAIETVRPAADARSIRIEPAVDSLAGMIKGDSNRLQQVAWNLLSNAIKFTPPGGRVWVRLEKAGAHAQITVTDTGQGISPDFLPYVFDRFRQADSSYTRKHGGLGLGLAIVRHIVEMHGGTVQAQSAGEGQGATFTVKLPIYGEASLPAMPGADSERARSAAQADRPSRKFSFEGLRLLIVDDEPDTLEVLSTALKAQGADVRTAPCAAAGLEVIARWLPDLLVSDIGMRDEDGYTFIKKIRGLDPSRGGDIPAIALTAYARKEDRDRALAAGYQMHLAKPFDITELLETIAGLSRKKGSITQ